MLVKNQITINDDEDSLSDEQLATIRKLLVDMQNRVKAREKIVDLSAKTEQSADEVEKAQEESAWLLAVKKRAWDNDLLTDIEKALYKMNTGEYGYCERSGEPINFERLLAYPTSRMTVEEQARYEQELRKV